MAAGEAATFWLALFLRYGLPDNKEFDVSGEVFAEMIPYAAIYLLVSAGLPICFINHLQYRRIFQYLYFLVIALILTVFAGVRSSRVDRDYNNYTTWFDTIIHGTALSTDWLRDPAFALLALLAHGLGLSFTAVAVMYALLGLLATIYLVTIAVAPRWSTLFFYLFFCQYFIVGEMTQIRSAVALPLMAAGLYMACKKQWLKASGFYIFALLFHFEVIIVLPLFILLSFGVRFKSRNWVLLITAFGLFISMEMGRVIDSFSDMYRISEYIHGVSDSGSGFELSWYSIAHILTVIICLAFFWRKMSIQHRMAIICCSSGIMLYQIFSSYKTLAIRFLYQFDLYWFLILVVILERIKGDKRFAYISLLALTGLVLYIQSVRFYAEPYSTVFD
jgi:hypothetical protein